MILTKEEDGRKSLCLILDAFGIRHVQIKVVLELAKNFGTAPLPFDLVI